MRRAVLALARRALRNLLLRWGRGAVGHHLLGCTFDRQPGITAVVEQRLVVRADRPQAMLDGVLSESDPARLSLGDARFRIQQLAR